MKPQALKEFEKKVIKHLKSLLPAGEKVLVGVSGGADSIFLLDLLKRFDQKSLVVHINHQIRAAASQDAEFVSKTAKPFETIIVTKNIPTIAKRQKRGLEEVGRIERYKAFRQAAQDHKISHILTAHHAGDNAESILMNLTRGCGLQGLTGILPTQKHEGEFTLIRPLLPFSPEQIRDYLDTKKIPYLKDETNSDTAYTRNFIRHEILPKLHKINPAFANALGKTSKLIQETQDFLSQTAQTKLDELAITPNHTKIDAKAFRNLHPTLQKTILRQIHFQLAGHKKNLENIHLEEVLKIIQQNIGNKQKKFGSLIAKINKNVITFTLSKSHQK